MARPLIRSMQSTDTAAVASLAQEVFAETYAVDWDANAQALARGAAEGKVAVLVAEVGGAVAGYANLRSWPAGGWIDQIVVDGSHRRQGVGRALLEAVLSAARERKLWKVSLITSVADSRAIGFFHSCYFEIVGPMRDEIKKGTDGLLMSKVIDYDLHPNAEER